MTTIPLRIRNSLANLLNNPWFMALVLLSVFFIVTDYKFGWDDQNLEIPLLKHLIDPALYQGDYYVESLQKNFSSYFYPILARLISVEQVPAAYFWLYVIARYFLLFWIYKLWLHLSRDKFKAFCCVLVFIFMARVQEFLYRTFSHQEFALGIIFAGIYFFFKERYILASILLGLAANLHALYSLFPMLFIETYLLWRIREYGFKTIFLTGLAFTACASPFIWWIADNRLLVNPASRAMADPNWLELFLLACPQNFFFPEHPLIPLKKLVSDWNIFLHLTKSYLVLIALFLLNFIFNREYRTNKRALAFTAGAFGLVVVAFFYTYIYQSRFVIDLNLVRNTQFILFLLMGYTTMLVVDKIQNEKAVTGLALAVLFTFIKYSELTASLSLVGMMFIFVILYGIKIKERLSGQLTIAAGAIGVAFCLYPLVQLFNKFEFGFMIRLNLAIIFLLLIVVYFAHYWFKDKRQQAILKKMFIIVPLAVFLYQYGYYHRQQVQTEREGLTPFWKLQVSWEDMQRYVKANTPKEAMVFIPYNMEMGGFRIQSERKVVVCYRDCGIIGFDYAATQEWRQRINDVKPYKVTIDGPFTNALKIAISKYKADYIVFMRYAAPPKDRDFLERIYTNRDFVLFKVNVLNY